MYNSIRKEVITIKTYFIIGQILTFLSYLIYWISRFKKTKNKILFSENISWIVGILGFIFLRTYDGIKNAVFTISRNAIGQITNKKTKIYKRVSLIILLIILIIIYYFDFQGISTIFIAISGILNLYAAIMSNEQGIRIFGMIGSFFYAGFMFFTGNYTGTACEVISFLSMLLSYIKYKEKSPKTKKM